tara:strand:- start:6691 stop:9507 length:2817 start_codon:yes stop_codon:yes gene_type:complete
MPLPIPLPDHFQLRQWQDNFLQLNQQRLSNARTQLHVRQQRLLDLLPLLLHVNHPQLPGFVDHQTPCGIDHYQVTANTEQALRHLIRSIPRLNQAPPAHYAIGGLYLMGSMGSLAQNRHSDLDIWVCLNQPLDPAQQEKLQNRCQRIEKWAASHNTEVHLFIMDLEEFRRGQQQAASGEDCGTSQYLLLLDEFYRSSVWLAGRYPRWWLTPEQSAGNKSNSTSDQYWQELINRHQIKADQWLHFGDISTIPVDEFLGAALWQLHKGMSGPYKALLKLLLYREYASQYPKIQPLCQDLKHNIHNNRTTSRDSDAYLLMLERVSQSLTNQQPARLELIRRAFYDKTGLKLSRLTLAARQQDWRAKLMQQLTTEWQWSEADLFEHDSKAQWSPQQVFRERNDLVAELLGSYRSLSQFSQCHVNTLHISPTDIQTLGNQLIAAFDSRPGKIIQINPGISPSLAQSQLTLLRYPGVWQLAPGYWQKPPPDHRILRQSPSLIELLAFAISNSLINRDTRISCYPDDAISRYELTRTLATLAGQMIRHRSLPDWSKGPAIQSLTVFINVTTDPLERYSQAGLQKLSDQNDALNFSSSHHNLVSTIDILACNSWNEWQVYRFQGEHGLNEALCLLMPLLADRQQRASLEIHSFSKHRAARIRQRTLQLLSSALAHYRRRQGRFLYQLGERCYSLEACTPASKDAAPRWQVIALNDTPTLMTHLAQPASHFCPSAVDRWVSQLPLPLNELMLHCQPRRWQLFYQRQGDQLDFYLVDEWAALVHQRIRRTELAHWLLPTLRFLRRLQQRWHGDHPQFEGLALYELKAPTDNNRPASSSEAAGLWQVRQRDIPVLAETPAAIELTARFDIDNQPTLYCNYAEFSIWQHGQHLYRDISAAVIQRRSQQQHYPCYLSDVVFADPGNQLLLTHWQQKQVLEAKINQAMQSNR